MLKGMKNQVLEWGFVSGKAYNDPFNALELDVVVKDEAGREWKIPAYWAGGNDWRVRFAAPHTGRYSFESTCTDSTNTGLHGVKGEIGITEYVGNNRLYRHGPVKVSENGRYFVHEDGTPFFWLGDTWWMGFCARIKWPEEFRMLAQDRINKGFTVIQIVNGLYCDCTPFDKRGENEAGYCWEKDWTAINPSYYDLADLKLAWLVKSGLVPCMVSCWGFYSTFLGHEKIKKHLRNMVARFGAYPLIWCLAGETRKQYYGMEAMHEESKKFWSDMAAYLKETDPYGRLLTTHAIPYGNLSLDEINNPEILDFNMFQGSHTDNGSLICSTVSGPLKKAYDSIPTKPVVCGESNYEGIMTLNGERVQRFLFWNNFLGGAAGYTYGAQGIWAFSSEDDPFGASPHGWDWGETPWQEAYKLNGSKQVGIGKKIMEQYEWWRIKPANERITYSDSVEPFYRPIAAEIPGGQLIVYVNNLNDPHIAKTHPVLTIRELEADALYNTTFYNPIDGQIKGMKQIRADSNGCWVADVPKIFHDWLLVMERKL